MIRLHHVEREALRHLDGDGGRHGKLGAVYDRIDGDGTVMHEGGRNAITDIDRVFEANAANTDGFGHCREIGIIELGTEIEEPRRFLLEVDKAEFTVVKHPDLYGQAELPES
jgi:hypothetical protein